MQSTRCKFYCKSILDYGANSPKEVTFTTQYCPEVPEDVRFTKATPYGEMKVSIDNPAALDMLKPGQHYYIDISPVPKPPEVKVEAPTAKTMD